MTILEQFAQKLFDIFVTNDRALAIQTDSGYKTVEIDVTPEIFTYMLRTKSAIAVYQQATYKDTLRWLCFDFDCILEGGLNLLYTQVVYPFTQNLSSLCIPYITEFSGRRGFHVWIILDCMISKAEGFFLLESIKEKCIPYIDNDIELYNLDRFPATASGHNKYGKAVKIPLSYHKKGNYSQLFIPDEKFQVQRIEELSEEFLKKQYDILASSASASYKKLKEIFLNATPDTGMYDFMRKSYIFGREITLHEVLSAMAGSKVLEIIAAHISHDALNYLDRCVLAGLFGHITGGEDLLHSIMQTQSNYDPTMTHAIISSMRPRYFSLCFGQLYSYYAVPLEESLDPKVCVIEWILNRLGIEYTSYRNDIQAHDPDAKGGGTYDIVQKEKNYQLYNDEVVDVIIYNDLQHFSLLDMVAIDKKVDAIERGDYGTVDLPIYKKYTRLETESRQRKLISLSAYDRILTTALTFRFAEGYAGVNKGYSYHLNRMIGGDIFFPWMNSWARYKKAISAYLKIPMFSTLKFVKIDIHHFYDSIRLNKLLELGNIEIEENTISNNKTRNIFEFLIKYNAKLMMAEGIDHGVPQGPAYARILAELFISTVINNFLKNNNFGLVRYYRYVDDIYVFLEPEIDSEEFLTAFSKFLEENHLYINKDKTKNWGTIGDISQCDIDELCEYDTENYKIQNMSNLDVYEEEDLVDSISLYDAFLNRNGQWNIKDANFLLNSKIDDVLSRMYLKRFGDQILGSAVGRGSIFSKFYNLIFSTPSGTKNFFTTKAYNLIPCPSINMSNMITVLFFTIKRDYRIADTYSSRIKQLCQDLLQNDVTMDDSTTLQAILDYLKLRE